MTGTFRVERVVPDAMPAHRAAWTDLATRALDPTVFNAPGFVLAALRHLPRPKHLAFLLVWDPAIAGAGALVGLAGIVPGRLLGADRLARCWSHPQATSAFPLLDRAAAADVLPVLLAAVPLHFSPAAALLIEGLMEGSPTMALFDAKPATRAVVGRRTRAILLAGAPPARSGKARKEARRQWNRLVEQGDLRSTTATSPNEVRIAIDHFVALEQRGWKGRRRTAFGARPHLEAFARGAMADLAEDGCIAVESLMLDDRPIAMGVVLRSLDRGFYWKTAYDEAFARFSPGIHLTERLTDRQLRDPNVSMTDSCATEGHAMIDRLWPDRSIVVDCAIAVAGHSSRAFEGAVAGEATRRRVVTLLKRARTAVRRHLSHPTEF